MRILGHYCRLIILSALVQMAFGAETAFNVRLEGVKFDYPGFEHWAVIKGPDGKPFEAFAIYLGKDQWRIPFAADAAGKYELLRVERRRDGKSEEDVIAKDAKRELVVEATDRRVKPEGGEKPLVSAGEFSTFYTAEEPWCVNDHTFAQGPDKRWHLFGITHPKPLSWEKDPGRQLCHINADTLLQKPWQTQPFAVKRDLEKYHEYLLWAPHVVRDKDTYYMFVCVGDPGDHGKYRIHLLTSTNLFDWQRSPDNPMVTDGFDARDPFVTRIGDEWVLYYTANSTPQCGNHVVACVTSKDLVHWGDRRVVFTHPRAGSFGGPTESPVVVRRGSNYYLFACDNDWTDVYVSKDPFHWDFESKNTRIQSHASEIVRDSDGKWYISHAGWTGGPLRLAPLLWSDGLDQEPTNFAPAEK